MMRGKTCGQAENEARQEARTRMGTRTDSMRGDGGGDVRADGENRRTMRAISEKGLSNGRRPGENRNI